jgi:DNA (cytosine-5)-methyltransferase 1
MAQVTAFDLFCGAGGLSEGLKQAGFHVLGAIDNDKTACAAYRMNHHDVRLWEKDVRSLSGIQILKALNIQPRKLSLLAACPPCQGFSTMRTKNGRRRNRDPRNDLIFEVLRIARSLRPVSVMVENVPGLAKSARFVSFCRRLEGLGYNVKWKIFDAVDFNVPQRRRRLVLLASRFGEPEFALAAKHRPTVRTAIGHLTSPRDSRDPLHNYCTLRSKRIEKLIKQIPRDGGSRQALGLRNQLPCHKRADGFKDVYGRMAWDEASPTITGGCINPSKGRFLHPQANRAITLREAALLQTFPRGYKFPLERGRYPAAELIGNALPPEFVKRHATALRRTILAQTT